jgi:hypothetical protein
MSSQQGRKDEQPGGPKSRSTVALVLGSLAVGLLLFCAALGTVGWYVLDFVKAWQEDLQTNRPIEPTQLGGPDPRVRHQGAQQGLPKGPARPPADPPG